MGLASRGNPQPHVEATYRVLGLHPDKVWPAIVAQRKALLGTEYEKIWPELAPKKPVRSVTLDEWKRRGRKAA